MSLNNEPSEEDVSADIPIGIVDPMAENYLLWVENLKPKTRTTYAYAVAFAVIIASIALALIPGVPNLVHVAVGIPLGFAVFLTLFALSHSIQQKKIQEDSNYSTLKERYSAKQRLRMVIIAAVLFLVVSISINSYIPYVLGGIITMSTALYLYNFLRKTPYEVELYALGEEDPRDEPSEKEKKEQEAEDATAQETEAYVELVNSLPEDQRRILLNPKLNGALAVIDEDDIKNKKKRKLFGNKG